MTGRETLAKCAFKPLFELVNGARSLQVVNEKQAGLESNTSQDLLVLFGG